MIMYFQKRLIKTLVMTNFKPVVYLIPKT